MSSHSRFHLSLAVVVAAFGCTGVDAKGSSTTGPLAVSTAADPAPSSGLPLPACPSPTPWPTQPASCKNWGVPPEEVDPTAYFARFDSDAVDPAGDAVATYIRSRVDAAALAGTVIDEVACRKSMCKIVLRFTSAATRASNYQSILVDVLPVGTLLMSGRSWAPWKVLPDGQETVLMIHGHCEMLGPPPRCLD